MSPAKDNVVPVDPKPTNRLDGSVSPYLAAHAHDPVKWRPWGSAALKRAHRLDRPLLISIGYQSCHWCHVMQRESFKDPDLAGFINRHFVPVKIDRELRPDLDALYMSYVTATTGSGGWPLTVFATPDGIPFYGGTYFPRQSADPRIPGLADVLDMVLRAWKLQRQETLTTAEEVREYLSGSWESADDPLSDAAVADAATALRKMEDPSNGGIGAAPKFPQAPACTFLLEFHRLTGQQWAMDMALRWMRAMLRGGIRDHIGGGIFRYSTDARWSLPHFEKMLYDQGLLLSTLAALNNHESDTEFAHAARETADFLARDLARPEGGFDSSIDAETDGVEGATYTWTHEQLSAVLDDTQMAIAKAYLGADETDLEGGLEFVVSRRAGRENQSAEVDEVLALLRDQRDLRPQPAVIDNVLVSWNALVARGLIEAGASFKEPTLTQLGLSTIDFLVNKALIAGEVTHAIGDPSVARMRLLEDSASLSAACLSAAILADRRDLLKLAIKLHTKARKQFRAEDGRMLASAGDPLIPLMPVDQADAPTPSGAALFAENAARLASITGDTSYAEDAAATLRQFSRAARAVPALAGHALTVAAMLGHEGPPPDHKN
ncbi:MAG: thioredoxin domain-containing protein [Actinomycetota bacterium]|nr:thioredoxin domain-containing protein [Actinomycetota bacterium]